MEGSWVTFSCPAWGSHHEQSCAVAIPLLLPAPPASQPLLAFLLLSLCLCLPLHSLQQPLTMSSALISSPLPFIGIPRPCPKHSHITSVWCVLLRESKFAITSGPLFMDSFLNSVHLASPSAINLLSKNIYLAGGGGSTRL